MTGLVRSDNSAAIVSHLKAEPLRGSLDDLETLSDNAKSHDAVIHCAMDMSGGMEKALEQEMAIIDLFANALEGSNKPFLVCSGTAFLADGSDEDSRVTSTQIPRGAMDNAVIGLRERGIRSTVVRLAMNTHSPDSIHLFLNLMIQAERQLGYVPFLENIRWSACNAEDAGLLFAKVLEDEEAMPVVHAVQETVAVKDIAELVATKTDKVAGQVTPDKLGEIGFLGMLLGLNQAIKTDVTRSRYDWNPTEQGLLEEVEQAGESYFRV